MSQLPQKIALGVLAVIAAFGVLLAAGVALVLATLRIERIASPAAHALAALGELILGAAALFAAVYIATRVVVRAFAKSAANDATAPNDPATAAPTYPAIN